MYYLCVTNNDKMNSIVTNIYNLISGKGFFMMGAQNMGYDNSRNLIQWKIRGSKTFTHISIAYEMGTDLYTVTFTKMRGFDVKNQETFEGVYVDMVRPMIENKTGLYLSL